VATEVKLAGALVMRTVAAEYARALPPGDLVIDFSAVTEADSAALALALDWVRRSRARGTAIRLHALPHSLVALAEVYGVTRLLPVADSEA
jgi:phospholipid transport system transporter-binding protein